MEKKNSCRPVTFEWFFKQRKVTTEAHVPRGWYVCFSAYFALFTILFEHTGVLKIPSILHTNAVGELHACGIGHTTGLVNVLQ